MSDTALLSAAAAVILAAAATYFLYVDFLARGNNPSVPLAPGARPFVGHLLEVIPRARERRFHAYLEHLAETVGDLALLRMLLDNFVVVSEAAAAKTVFTDGANWARPDHLQKALRDVIVNGLFALPSNDIWKSHRKALQPGFGPTHLRHTAEAANLVADELVDQWSAFAKKVAASSSPGGPAIVDAHIATACATLDVLGHVAFSYSFGSVKSLAVGNSKGGLVFGACTPVHEQFQAYAGVFRVLGGRNIPRALWWTTRATEAEMKPARDAVVKSVVSVLENRKHCNRANIGEAEKDFLDRLLDADKFSEKDIIDEMITFFLAGFETTANTLTTCMMCLAGHPEVMRKLQEEVDLVLGPSGKVNMDNLPSLQYTEQVIKETLRLHPTVPALRRKALRDTVLGSHVISKGTFALVNIQGLHRRKQYWDRPLEFNPGRWSSGFVPSPGTFLPFGDGPHNCIGQKMAMIELKTFLAKIVSRFEWKIVPGQDLTLRHAITAGVRDGLLLELYPRSDRPAAASDELSPSV